MIVSASGEHLTSHIAPTMLNFSQVMESFVCTAIMIPTSVMDLFRWSAHSER